MAGPRTVHEAVRRGQPRSLVRLVREGAAVDEPDEQGWTALMVAALRGQLGLVQPLLRLGADPNATGPKGSPLVQAAWGGSVPVLEALVAAGADVGRFGSEAVAKATRRKHADAARWLLERGACGEWSDEDGMSLLDVAFLSEPGLIGPLLRAGANPAGHTGRPPLARAILFGHPEAVELLLEAGAPVDAPGDAGRESFCAAIQTGPLELVQRLVARGARPDGEAARFAAQAGQLEALRWLAAQGADLHGLDPDGENARTLARGQGHDEVEAWLAGQGVPAQPEVEARVAERRAEALRRREEEARRLAEAEAARQALQAGGARPGKVVEGPFANFTGLATVLPSGELQVVLVIFGRSTPVKLRPEQWRFDEP